MISPMNYFSKYKQLDGFAELAHEIDFYFNNINIRDKNAIIDRIMYMYNEQGIIGDVPSYHAVMSLWENKKFLTSAGKRKLNSLGKIYEYKVNLGDIQIRDTHVYRIRFNTDKAIVQFNKTFISLEKDFENTNYQELLTSRLTYICDICYKYDCTSIKELVFLCNNVNKYEKEAYDIYKNNWDKTQGKKVKKMNKLFNAII